ncbi:MarR family winged helix-turn-helix transcriptional regulator [Subtercola frigoramans]|uniref:DNA-binding MarR family transcriptional regulator n=1 Tax=Subtercola frigoramans TaxID=120298 RepID=A0ABS2L4E4_9MICO|nr:MarR family transcriptional regulator [Subtercola frigoramans]MBM7471970.1 DNA-binding MarR family transcriptional regulator [Subtercola frigoramans]
MTTDVDTAGTDSETDLSSQLRQAVLRTSRRLRAEKADSELSDTQSVVLAYLYNHGPSTPGELARFERVTPPSMNRTINAVVDAGYAKRSPSVEDGRKVVVTLTPAGAALTLETRRRRDEWLHRRLDELTDAERETLLRASGILRGMADS